MGDTVCPTLSFVALRKKMNMHMYVAKVCK